MEATKNSIFSIDHILGTEVGPPFPAGRESLHSAGCLPGGSLQGLSNGFTENFNYNRPLTAVSMVPFPVMHGFDYSYLGYGSYNYQPSYNHHHDLIHYPNAAVGLRMGFNNERGSHSPALHHRGQTAIHRQRGRMRTVFTDSQTRSLEQQFQVTDYPDVETRAELARSSGLNEETVRVWFKNRRARRKRQRSVSRSPSAEARGEPRAPR